MNIILFPSYFTSESMFYLDKIKDVPTKYKRFCARFGQCGKSRSLQVLLESTKNNGATTHFFEIITLESQ